MGDILGHLKEDKLFMSECPITPQSLGDMIGLIEDGTISGKIAKDVFEEMWRSGKEPKIIIEEKGWCRLPMPGPSRRPSPRFLRQIPLSLRSTGRAKTSFSDSLWDRP